MTSQLKPHLKQTKQQTKIYPFVVLNFSSNGITPKQEYVFLMILSEIKMLKNSCHIQLGMLALDYIPKRKHNMDVFFCHHKNMLPLLLPGLLQNHSNLSTYCLEQYISDLLQILYFKGMGLNKPELSTLMLRLAVCHPFSFWRTSHSRMHWFLTILALLVILT